MEVAKPTIQPNKRDEQDHEPDIEYMKRYVLVKILKDLKADPLNSRVYNLKEMDIEAIPQGYDFRDYEQMQKIFHNTISESLESFLFLCNQICFKMQNALQHNQLTVILDSNDFARVHNHFVAFIYYTYCKTAKKYPSNKSILSCRKKIEPYYEEYCKLNSISQIFSGPKLLNKMSENPGILGQLLYFTYYYQNQFIFYSKAYGNTYMKERSVEFEACSNYMFESLVSEVKENIWNSTLTYLKQNGKQLRNFLGEQLVDQFEQCKMAFDFTQFENLCGILQSVMQQLDTPENRKIKDQAQHLIEIIQRQLQDVIKILQFEKFQIILQGLTVNQDYLKIIPQSTLQVFEIVFQCLFDLCNQTLIHGDQYQFGKRFSIEVEQIIKILNDTEGDNEKRKIAHAKIIFQLKKLIDLFQQQTYTYAHLFPIIKNIYFAAESTYDEESKFCLLECVKDQVKKKGMKVERDNFKLMKPMMANYLRNHILPISEAIVIFK